MPKKHKTPLPVARAQSKKINENRTQIIRGKFARYSTLSSGFLSVNSLGDLGSDLRLASISDMFELYRFRKLHITITEGSWGSGLTAGKYSTGYAMALYLELPDTFPTTDHTKALREPHSLWMDGSWAAGTAGTASATAPALQCGYSPRSMRLGPHELIGNAPLKWWRTRQSSAGTPTTNLWQDVQWSIAFVAEDTSLGSGLQFTWWYEYEIEFSDPVDPSQTPLPDVSRLMVRASDEELRQLEKRLLNERTRRLAVGNPPTLAGNQEDSL